MAALVLVYFLESNATQLGGARDTRFLERMTMRYLSVFGFRLSCGPKCQADTSLEPRPSFDLSECR